MKKVILSVAMMFAAFLTQAAVGKQVEEVKLKSGEEKMRTVDWGNEASPGEEGLCTITMKGRRAMKYHSEAMHTACMSANKTPQKKNCF